MSMLRYRFSNERWGGGGGRPEPPSSLSYSVKVCIFKGIKLKLDGGVNSETVISYFMSVFAIQSEFDKNKGVLCHFFTEFIRPLFNKSVAMIIKWMCINKSPLGI